MKNIFSFEKLTHVHHGCVIELDQALTMLFDAGKRPLLIHMSVRHLDAIVEKTFPTARLGNRTFHYKQRETGKLVPMNHDESLDEFTFTVETEP